MSARMIVELPSGTKVLFGGKGAPVGLSEVALTDRLPQAASDKFKSALGSLTELVTALEESVGRLAKRPDKVEMEFRASLSAECDLWIVAGDGEAEFKVKLAWGQGD